MTETQPNRPVDDERPEWLDDVAQLVADLGELGDLPYDPTPARLYRPADLYRGFDAGGFATTMDQAAYRRARVSGQPPIPPREALAQRLHDHGITVALDRFRADHRLVGVMGGHALVRGTDGFRQGIALGRAIAEAGFCVVTGGGPGAMEAANLGAATSTMAQTEVEALHRQLAAVPTFEDDPDGFTRVALEVAAQIVEPVDTLSVPTWFYGHEPSNPFATHIAKYFSNSEREDGLLAVATAGIVFLAGGPGTIQEVFQDAAQNAYRTFGHPSPMVFLDPPDRPDHWVTDGVMQALDATFTNHHGQRRPGWDLVRHVGSVADAVIALGTP
ncbi:MAG: Rossmann fold nucleotide-binding protein [Actinomycetota bacterium]